MRPGGSKQKGAAFERQVCKQLSLWVSNGARGDLFWRSAMSGGRATVAAKQGAKLAAQAGDISVVSGDRRASWLIDNYYIECKHLKQVSLRALIHRTKTGLGEIWDTAVTEATRYNKTAVLIAKQNHYDTYLMVSVNWHRADFIDPRVPLRARFFLQRMDVFLFDDVLALPMPDPPVDIDNPRPKRRERF